MSVSRQLLAFSQISGNSGMLVEEHLFCSATFDVDFLSKFLCVDLSGSCAKKCIEFRWNLMKQYLIAKTCLKLSQMVHLEFSISLCIFLSEHSTQKSCFRVNTVKSPLWKFISNLIVMQLLMKCSHIFLWYWYPVSWQENQCWATVPGRYSSLSWWVTSLEKWKYPLISQLKSTNSVWVHFDLKNSSFISSAERSEVLWKRW